METSWHHDGREEEGMESNRRERRIDFASQFSQTICRTRMRASGYQGRGSCPSLAGCLLVLSTAVLSAHAMPFDSEWGNTWSNSNGTFALEVRNVVKFYRCSVKGDNNVYETQKDCAEACRAGTCKLVGEQGRLSAPQLVALNPNTPDARHVVVTMLNPLIQVGSQFSMLIKAVDPNMVVSVQEDPGMPIGMTSKVIAPSMIEVAWVPRVGQEGLVHELSVGAIHPHISSGKVNCNMNNCSCVSNFNCTGRSRDLRVRIAVAAGGLAWSEPAEEESVLPLVVGETKTANLVCVSNYAIRIDPRGDLPNGMTLDVKYQLRKADALYSVLPLEPLRGSVTFRATLGSQGLSSRGCFTCHSLLLPLSEVRCVTFVVDACKYATKPSDSLYSLSRMLHASNNWRRMLNLNAELPADPLALMGNGQVIQMGTTYTIEAGDSLHQIAARLSTTVKGILHLNPSLGSESAVLQVGAKLCVAACTAHPNPTFDPKEAF